MKCTHDKVYLFILIINNIINYKKFNNIAILLSKYVQSQNIIYPLTIINFLVILINTGMNSLLIFHFGFGLR
jgi:hypothetical protein